jgi:hypothetical protein
MSFGAPGAYPIPGGGAEAAVSTGYSSAATSIVLSSGQGARFPSTPFYLTWYNFTDFPFTFPQSGKSLQRTLDPNREVVLVSSRSVDTLTIVRGQLGTTATAKNIGSKTYKVRISGPRWNKMHIYQPEYDDVTDEHVYEDGGNSFVLRNDSAPIVFLCEYQPNLSAVNAGILDAHRAEAFGKAFGFDFLDPRTGTTYTNVHYLEWSEDHARTWRQSRIVKLIKRPA